MRQVADTTESLTAADEISGTDAHLLAMRKTMTHLQMPIVARA